MPLSLADRSELTALRLTAQRIDAPDFEHPQDAVRHLLAMQAQDYHAATWSVGLRVPRSTAASVEQAMVDRLIVRSWPMRGTLHFVRPEDLKWMLGLSRPRLKNRSAKRRGELGITDDELASARRIVERVLAGRVMRRDALLDRFEAAGIPTTGQRAYHLLWNLGHEGRIVFGPMDGKQPTFALLDEWIPRPRTLTREEALAEFALRYFSSHGPATVRDFAWWCNQTLGDARTGLAAIASQLESRDWGGDTFWFRPGLAPAPNAAHLLPGFDEFMLGYQDRSAPLAAEFADRIVPGKNGVFQPTIVIGGLIAGTWRRTATSKRVTVDAQWFGAASPITSCLRLYGAFFEVPAVTQS